MAEIDKLYENLCHAILNGGYNYIDSSRDVTCRQLTSANLEIGITTEFPLLTTKKMFTKAIVVELIWFLRGDANIKYLIDNGINIWNKDAYNWYSKHYDMYYSNSKQNKFTLEEFVSRIKEAEDVKELKNFQNLDIILGDVGRNYGVQWRKWMKSSLNYELYEEEYPSVYDISHLDQISELLINLKIKPISRRHIVTAWNPAEVADTALPPCHWAFEILPFPLKPYQRIRLSGEDKDYMEGLWESAHIAKDEKALAELEDKLKDVPTYGFSLKWHQRSVDTFLGLPFNIASYALLAMIIEGLTGYKAMGIIADLSNVHFYENHIEAVTQQLENDSSKYSGCTLQFSEKIKKNFFSFKEGNLNFEKFIDAFDVEDVIFVDYKSYESIKGEMLAPNT